MEGCSKDLASARRNLQEALGMPGSTQVFAAAQLRNLNGPKLS